MTIKIVSAAQHAMLTKAANDQTYAQQRGISQEVAREAIAAHEASSKPKLPERVEPKSVAPRATAKVAMPVYLTSQRG